MHSIQVLNSTQQHQQLQEHHHQTSLNSQQQQQQQQQQQHHHQQQEQTTMTILETLNPNQQLIPDNHQHHQVHENLNDLLDNNLNNVGVMQHQQQTGIIYNQQPLLHQLQPSHHQHQHHHHNHNHNHNHELEQQQLNQNVAQSSQNQTTTTSSSDCDADHQLDNQHQQSATQRQHYQKVSTSNSNNNNNNQNSSSISSSSTTRSTNSNRRRSHPEVGILAPLHDSGGPIVQWLRDRYEIAAGESLPRSTVYNHYLAYCRQLDMASVNAASFGKLIRSVFIGLKTRRLGTRGHSKYHYFGVRAKRAQNQDDSLELINGDEQTQIDNTIRVSSQHQHQHHHNLHELSSSPLITTDNNNINDNNTDNGSESTTDSTKDLTNDRLSSTGNVVPVKRIRTSCSSINNGRGNIAGVTERNEIVCQNIFDLNNQQQQHNYNDNNVYYSDNSTTINGYDQNCINKQPSSHEANHQQHNHHHHHHHQQIGSTIYEHHHSHQQHQQNQYNLTDLRNHLGANWATLVDEHWPLQSIIVATSSTTTTLLPKEEQERRLDNANNNNNNNVKEFLDVFEEKYKLYYKKMVELLSELKFSEIELLWQEFWRPINNNNNNNIDGNANKLHQDDWSLNNNNHNDHTALIINNSNQMNNMQQQQQHQTNPNDIIQHHHNHHQHHYEQQSIVSLNFHQLYELTSNEQVINRINQIDYSLYSAIESFLLPDILSPIPRLLIQEIRLFAKNICLWIEQSVRDYQPHFVNEKSKSARAFGYALRRYTSLNHLSSASRAIWDKQDLLTQMSIDLSRIDLREIEHQVSLMSQNNNDNNSSTLSLIGNCSNSNNNNDNNATSSNKSVVMVQLQPSVASNQINTTNITSSSQQQSLINDNSNLLHHHHHQHTQNNNMLNQQQNINGTPNCNLLTTNVVPASHLCAMEPGQLIQNFLHLLEDPCPANSWPDWCKNLVETRVSGSSVEEAKNFILKWNFFISLIMKELTLRSAPSFGSFQLIRLLFDEYIFYLVISRLAQAQNKTPTQLLSS